MSDDFITPFKLEMFMGHAELETRMRPEGPNRIIGEGRSRYYNQHGQLTEDTGWQPTGVVMTFSEGKADPEKRPWWRFC